MQEIKYKIVCMNLAKTKRSKKTELKTYRIRVDHLPNYKEDMTHDEEAKIEEHCLNVASRLHCMNQDARIVRNMHCSFSDFNAFEHDGQHYYTTTIY